MATIPPTFPSALQLHQSGNLQQAETMYRQILDADPGHADSWHLLGVLVHQQGRNDTAIEYIQKAVQLQPSSAVFHNNLGIVLQQHRRPADAIVHYREALRIRPDYAEAHNNLGNVFKEQEQLADAEVCYRDALRFRSDYADAHYNLGLVCKLQRKPAEAIVHYREALRIRPNHAEAHNNLGNVFKEQGQLAEAEACYRESLRLKPSQAEVYNNLGDTLRNQGHMEACSTCYEEALRIRPDFAEAHVNYSYALLLQGDFERAWPEWEWRWQCNSPPPRPFPQPLWDGAALAGKTILLHAEQGLGDTLQFIRYAPYVRKLGGTVIVECQKPLLRLLARCAGIDQLVARGSPLPAFDVHAPLLSLPGIMKTTLATVPADVPYVFPDDALLEHWRRELHSFPGFKAGIAWQGNLAYSADWHRSIPLEHFIDLARIEGVRLFSLQKGAGTDRLRELAGRCPIVDLGSQLDETSGAFMDTAAVIKNLDLTISADTAIGHLAGALGARTWTALSSAAEWRWLVQRDDSPWYPTVRLFRQEKLGDWQPVFKRMAIALKKLM